MGAVVTDMINRLIDVTESPAFWFAFTAFYAPITTTPWSYVPLIAGAMNFAIALGKLDRRFVNGVNDPHDRNAEHSRVLPNLRHRL